MICNNLFILLWRQEHGCRPIRKINSNSKHQEVVSHYIFKESVNLHFCVYVHFFDMKTKKNIIKKSCVEQDSNPQLTYL